DLLPLAFERRLRGEDLLGEVPGRVGLGRGKAVRRWRRGCQRGGVGAFRAELGGWGDLTAAVPARPGQGRGALFAELRRGLVLMLAPRTVHIREPTLNGHIGVVKT